MNPVRDKNNWYTYILRGQEKGTWYTGVTYDLRKRLQQHQSGQTRNTRGRGPLALIYYEVCKDQEDARSRELYLKSGMGKRYLRNRLKRFLSLTG